MRELENLARSGSCSSKRSMRRSPAGWASAAIGPAPAQGKHDKRTTIPAAICQMIVGLECEYGLRHRHLRQRTQSHWRGRLLDRAPRPNSSVPRLLVLTVNAGQPSRSRACSQMMMTTKAVMMQITTVSMNGSHGATKPSDSRSRVRAAKWVMVVEPTPASLERAARRKPWIRVRSRHPARPRR